MEIGVDISNKLFFDAEIGMNIYEKMGRAVSLR